MSEEETVKTEQSDEQQFAEDVKVESVDYEAGRQKLADLQLDPAVADMLIDIYKTGNVLPSELEDQTLQALTECSTEGGLSVLGEFRDSDLAKVGNKSAYLCGLMRSFRKKPAVAPLIDPADNIAIKRGPNEEKMKEILDRTGYAMEVTSGQRKYGGPPPDWEGKQPGAGHEVFFGRLPRDMYEDELIPLIEPCGRIWDLRIMMEPVTGTNRGYCFVTFCEKEGAEEAVKNLNGYVTKEGKKLKVNISVANNKLFVGNIPKTRSKEEILQEFQNITEGVIDVIVYSSPDETGRKNRGFAFVEYDSHKLAAAAKKKLTSGRLQVFGCDVVCDWADPLDEPDQEVMSKVKILYIRNLKAAVTDEQLKEKFATYGAIERVKRVKDYGFVHFEEREAALKAMQELNGQKIGDCEMIICLAKPPLDKHVKERRRLEQQQRVGLVRGPSWGGPSGPGFPLRGRGQRPPLRHQAFEYEQPYYDEYAGDGGFSQPFFEEYYDDFGYTAMPARGRGQFRGRPMSHISPMSRGSRGMSSMPSRGSGMGNGFRGGVRGRSRGMPAHSGRGGFSARGNQMRGNQKRKAASDISQTRSKKRNTQNNGNNWGAQPIAQQPLGQQGQQWY